MWLSETEFEQFRASLDRVLTNPIFLDAFYDAFFESAEGVQDYFNGIDIPGRKRSLHDSLQRLAWTIPGVRGSLPSGAVIPQEGCDAIPAALTEVWLHALLDAVSRCDPFFSERLEEIWRHCLQHDLDGSRLARRGRVSTMGLPPN